MTREKRNTAVGKEAAAPPPNLDSLVIARKLSPLYNAIGHLTRRLDQKISAKFDATIGNVRLTRTQFVLLIVAALVPGLEQAEMAVLASFDPATTGVVLHRLEGMGLVERTRSPRSRRGYLVQATARGNEVVEQQMTILDTIQSDILSPLEPDERLMLLRLLSKLVGVTNYFNAGDADSGSRRKVPGKRAQSGAE